MQTRWSRIYSVPIDFVHGRAWIVASVFGTARGRCRSRTHPREALPWIALITSDGALTRGTVRCALASRFRVERRRRACLRVVGAWRDLVKEGRRRRDLDQRRKALMLRRCFRGWRVLRAKSTLTSQVRAAIFAASRGRRQENNMRQREGYSRVESMARALHQCSRFQLPALQ